MAVQQKLDQLDQKIFRLLEMGVPTCPIAQERHMRRIEAHETFRAAVKWQQTPFPKGVSQMVAIVVCL